MGQIFNQMHLRLVAALDDTDSSSNPITVATTDGKKRTSAQRSRDLMDGRYLVHSLLRAVDKNLYYGILSNQAFDATGFLDISNLNVASYTEINLVETSNRYNDVIPLVAGEAMPAYARLLLTSKKNGMIVAVVGQNDASPRVVRLRLLKGAQVQFAYNTFKFDLGYFTQPMLEELDASSSDDVTEPRVWYPLIEQYALYLGYLGSGNFQRAQAALQDVQRIARNIISLTYGQDAANAVGGVLQASQG